MYHSSNTTVTTSNKQAPIPGRLLLAPMEGVIDLHMRELLTRNGVYDRCVTEFVRVTQTILPDHVFLRYCPELKNAGTTTSGTPVYLQLLGSDPTLMAASAARAAALGALGIDLNFGCPAKCVNRHNGGSILLNEPDIVRSIVDAVRRAVPLDTPVTVKIRLGVNDSDNLEKISRYVQEAGANELCIHARTKENGYKPPAFWSEVKPVLSFLDIPVTINGEIWSVEEAIKAQRASGCNDLMLGRGALSRPDLAEAIRASAINEDYQTLQWPEVVDELQHRFNHTDHTHPKYIGSRLKQWLVYLRREYPEATDLFKIVRTLNTTETINQAFAQHRLLAEDQSDIESTVVAQ